MIRLSRMGWRALLAGLIVAFAVPAAASAANYVYVSHIGSQNISVHKIRGDGSLTAVTGSPFATGGAAPFDNEGLAITPDGRRLYTANFTSANVRGFRVRSNGGLTQLTSSPYPTGPGTAPLGLGSSPDRRFLFVLNHGGADDIGSWSIAANGSLSQVLGSPFDIPVGQSAPFPVAVAPDSDHLYVPNEGSDTVTAYTVSAAGALSDIQTIATGNNPFGTAITPNGKFLYVSNPEANVGFANGSISAYSVGANGMLTELPGSKFGVGTGNHPLGMVVSPDSEHLYVATRVTSTVNAYNIAADGSLSAVPGSPFSTGGTNGKDLAMTPKGNRLYVSNNGSSDISGFDVAANGALSPVPGSPFATGGTTPDLESIVVTPKVPKCHGKVATLLGDAGADTIIGTPEKDVIVARQKGDVVRSKGGKDLICGGKGPDLLRGGKDDDRIFGEEGPDVLRGGAGDDQLVGGPGNDDLAGGPGKDTENP